MVENIGNPESIPKQPLESNRPIEKSEPAASAPVGQPEKVDASARQRLESDSIEISDTARRQQVELKQIETEKIKEEDNLQFTGNHFYTLGLNLIKQEAIASPSEPEIKP
jgi:hypothetical protein